MSNVEKTREQILAERQEKKKKKAALKNQSKEKAATGKDSGEPDKSKTSVKDKPSQNPVQTKAKVVESKTSSVTKVDLKAKDSVITSPQQNLTVNSSAVPEKENNEKLSNSSESVSNKQNFKSDSLSSEIKIEKPEKDNESKMTENQSGEGKTKSQLKAERRAKQEAERARKLQKAAAVVATPTQEKKVSTPLKSAQAVKTSPNKTLEISHKVKLFAHLYDISCGGDFVDSPTYVHPSIVCLRTQYDSRVVSGANASCLALLNALKKVIMDFETPPNQEFSRSLESEITKCMAYLSNQKPVEVSMMNAVKHLKFRVNQTKGNDLECKNSISDWIDTYIKEQLEMAAKAICLFVREKITSGDVILTYGWCSLIYEILISAYNEGIKFRVIVADGRPWLEGRELLKKLVGAGIQCTYVFVNGLSYVMPEVTKILLGAHALLANGYVMSRVGSSQVALLAKTYNVPVLVCCETHKFSERVQTDSFVYNELGNPDDLASSKGCLSKELSKWKTIQYLTPLNLMYDVTPPDLVSAVVTEIAVLPCTSVPVILRIKPPDLVF